MVTKTNEKTNSYLKQKELSWLVHKQIWDNASLNEFVNNYNFNLPR